jgi:cytochrome b involved in lipid metabolism
MTNARLYNLNGLLSIIDTQEKEDVCFWLFSGPICRVSEMALRTKKIKLKPGFALQDWSLLCSKATKLNGLQGKPIPEDGWTKAEIKTHNTRFDGWIIVRENVYNVTPYLPYHPGGDEIMMPVLGKDATKLYDRYHKYVSLSLLDACFVGKVKKRKKASKAGEDGSKDGLEGDSKPVGEDGEDDNKAGEDAGESESHSSHGADEGTGEVDKHWREV